MDQRDAQLVREIMARVEERTSLLDRIQVRFAIPTEYSQSIYHIFFYRIGNVKEVFQVLQVNQAVMDNQA